MTDETRLPDPAEMGVCRETLNGVLRELNRMLLGREELHELVLTGILARGHILLEGLPGVGKTALVRALGEVLDLEFRRVQFTPDLMPSDILGSHVLQDTGGGKREFVFQPGPVFTNLLLADEINRASPKTQSAMLETMQERSVTLLGTTRMLPHPFMVLASQNPIEMEGTYPLPEAQLDRFLFKLDVTEVDASVLERIITSRRRGEAPEPGWRMTRDDLGRVLALMERIALPGPVARYIARLVSATHPGQPEATEAVTKFVTYGASPRAAIALAESARGRALIQGRPAAGFDDVKAVAPHVLNHRVILNYQARFEQITTRQVVDELIRGLPAVANLDVPADAVVEAAG